MPVEPTTNPGLLSIGVSWPACKDAMQARARELAEQGLDQGGIMAVLRREFAGLPSENYYAYPAANGLMAHVKRAGSVSTPRGGGGRPAAPSVLSGEPDAAMLAAITNGRDLVALCARYGIRIGWDEEAGSLALSRTVDVDGALWAALKRYRSSLVKLVGAG